MKQKINDILEEINYSLGPLKQKIKSKHPELYQDIIKFWDSLNLSQNVSFSEKVYCYMNNYNPVCPKGNKRSFIGFFKGYYTGCYKQCPCAREKYINSMKEKYGTDSPLKSNEIYEKVQNTWLEKHGTTNLHEINQDKKQQTNIERYGKKYPLQSEKIQEKTKQSLNKNYQVSFPFQSSKIQNRIQNHWLQKTGKRSHARPKNEIVSENMHKMRDCYGEKADILYDCEKLREKLEHFSRKELADYIGCSITVIDKKIKDHKLTEFMGDSTYYEKIIENFLNNLSVDYEKNTRKVITPKELDFYIPNYNLAIEFNGLHWHGERLGQKSRTYHQDKTQLCKEKGIHLLHIFQDEWDKKSDVVKSIIKQHLGMNKRVYARNCSVTKLTNKQACDFLRNNHLYNESKGCFVHYGLFYGDNLVSVMNFKKQRNVIELSRFCNKIGITVIGGPSKLFNQFLKEYKPNKVVSFVDARYFTGTFCQSLGFKYVHLTNPNYYYFYKADKRWHRSNFTKGKLVEQGFDRRKSEKEIMFEQGWDRIWDSGHYKFIKELKTPAFSRG